MSQLEPMMAEEYNNANSYDGHDGVSRTVFVWGKTIMVNIQGEKQLIIPQQDKTNMTGGGEPGMSLSLVSGGVTV